MLADDCFFSMYNTAAFSLPSPRRYVMSYTYTVAMLSVAGGQVYGWEGGQEIYLRPWTNRKLCGQVATSLSW